MRYPFPILLLCYLLPIIPATAQENYGIEASFIAGKVIKHTPKFSAPVPPISTAYELDWLKQTRGTQAWEQRRKYPLWGIGAALVHYGVDSVYGNAIGVYPLLQVPIIRGKSLEWTMRAGLGIGYVSRHYERYPVWDTLDNAIGSHINNFSMIATDLRYRINSSWSLQLGLNFMHLSNGAMKQPNLGVNMAGGHIGLRYWPDGDRKPKIHSKLARLKDRVLIQARVGMAFEESGTTDGPIYHTYLSSLYASRRYRGKNKVFLGIDYSYHQSIYAFQRNNEINVGNEAAHSWKSAIFLGHEWRYGHMSLMTQIGVYIKEADLKQDPYYEKIGYNYYVYSAEHGPLKELCLSVLLKTHKSVAELIEYGITFGF